MASDENPRSSFVMKGAFIELKELFVGFLPNIVVFQYNPESLNRTVTPERRRPRRAEAETAGEAEGEGEAAEGESEDEQSTASAQPQDPRETISLSLVLDATDDLAEGNKLAIASGIADRIAAIELLTYPQNTLVDRALDAIGDAIGRAVHARQPEERPTVPLVLFWYGPGKIVPVRITSLSIEEQAFNSLLLYPTRARLSVGLKVLLPDELEGFNAPISQAIARGAYVFTREQKAILAALGGPYRAVDSLLGAIDEDLGGIL